jgi:hypothetical protein
MTSNLDLLSAPMTDRLSRAHTPPALRLAGIFAFAISWMVGIAPLYATMVAPMGLARVTHEAARIVQGTVSDVRSGRDESGLPATWVTLAVTRTFKGRAETALTFKQYGVATPLADGTVSRVAGVPSYRVGEEVVLFLRATSRRGFTSPVGLMEGVYRVSHAAEGARARNDLPPAESSRDLDAFLAEVARRVAEHP